MSLRPLWATLIVVTIPGIAMGIYYAGGVANAYFTRHSAPAWLLTSATILAAYLFWRTRPKAD